MFTLTRVVVVVVVVVDFIYSRWSNRQSLLKGTYWREKKRRKGQKIEIWEGRINSLNHYGMNYNAELEKLYTAINVANCKRNELRINKKKVEERLFESWWYVTLNRGFSGLWVRVCFLPPRSFRWAWHGMVDVLQAMQKSHSARYSRCTSTVVAYFPTQNSARGQCMSLQQSSFFSSPSVIELSTVDLNQYHKDVWMPRYGFLQNRHLFWPAVLRKMYFWCKA